MEIQCALFLDALSGDVAEGDLTSDCSEDAVFQSHRHDLTQAELVNDTSSCNQQDW